MSEQARSCESKTAPPSDLGEGGQAVIETAFDRLALKVRDLEAEKERLRDLAETAVFACLPLLPLNGSAQTGYQVNETVQQGR